MLSIKNTKHIHLVSLHCVNLLEYIFQKTLDSVSYPIGSNVSMQNFFYLDLHKYAKPIVFTK